MVLDGDSLLQEYVVNTGAPQGSILGPTLFLLYSTDPPGDVTRIISINADDTTFKCNCEQASDLCKN